MEGILSQKESSRSEASRVVDSAIFLTKDLPESHYRAPYRSGKYPQSLVLVETPGKHSRGETSKPEGETK